MLFHEIFGHERQKREILGFLNKKRIPNALMFTGPEGIGKRTLALKLAIMLLCKNGTGGDGCSSCIKAERRTHPDLFVLGEKKESIGIEEVKLISSEAQRRPHEAKKRIFLIDNCHLLTTEATNSILKTLEEPHHSSLFILVTHREWEILPTVKSRCVLIRFSILDEGVLTSYLMERYGLSREKADLLSQISLGRIGLCEFWIKEENRLLRREIANAVLKGKGDFLRITRLAEEIQKRATEQFLEFLASLFRDILVFNVTKDRKRLYNKDLLDLIEDVRIEPLKAHEISLKIKRAQRDMRYNINQWAYLEGLLLFFRNSL